MIEYLIPEKRKKKREKKRQEKQLPVAQQASHIGFSSYHQEEGLQCSIPFPAIVQLALRLESFLATFVRYNYNKKQII